MDASLDTEQDNIAGGDHNSEQQGEHQIGTSEDADTNAHLNLSKKSWGFRRTTIARREFMDEIIDLDPSPPPIRRGRSRRTRQTPRPAEDPQPTPKPCRSASSVIDDLEWSAPSSPVDAATSEATTGGVLDPSLWQDFGSAFHTAFSLLGGNEDTPMDVTDPLPGPDDPHPTDASEAGAEVCETGADGSDSVEAAEDPSGPALMDVAGDENQEVLLISSQEDDSDNLTLMQLKEHLTSKGPARKGGRAKARGKGRGRGRGRGRGKGRGRGRGRAVELESSTAEDDEEEDRTLVNQEARPQLHEPQKPEGSPEADVTLANPTKLIDSDCIVLDSDLDQPADVTQGQYENAVEEGRAEEERGYSSISDSEGYDPNALYCICRQKHNKRFMICCDGCHEWFHGDCVGIGEAQGRCMDRGGEEYTCPTCTSKKQRLPLPDNVQSEDLLESPEIPASLPDVLAPTASAETTIEVTKPQESKVRGDAEVMAEQSKPEPDIKTERESSLPLCIGPGCPKQALQDSVYCGTDCILQHAAVTMKSLTGPKEPKPRSRPQRKAAAKVRNSTLTANKDSEELEAKEESVPPVPQKPTTATSSSIPVADTPLPQGSTQGKTQKPLTTGGISKKQRLDSPQHTPTNLHKPSATPAPATPGPSSSRLPVMPAPKLAMGSFVIPKKQPAPPPAPSQGQDPVAGAQPSASPAATNETRTLPVAPAPIAPSSRPSQPNNQVRQSIQRSLASILFKRVTDCEELDMSESDVGKLVTSIEMEMFDIFRNTDSKYMNKYRTIMFNLKDPKNKGLLFRVIGGEISPFRLARMSQKDMQATKVPEPSAKETAEVPENSQHLKQWPPPISSEQKRSVAPVVKSRLTQPSQIGSVPDILSCMLKDTTSEHKTHLFDLKCKICTGQMPEEEEEPAHKRSKVSDSRDKREYGRPSYGKPPENPWRSCAGDDSPLQAPPDSPDTDSPLNPLLEPSSRLVIDSPELAIVESPASLVLESPASPPVLESPASPVRDSPASPTADGFKTRPPARAYAPVVIPAVSTVTITRRDPRTAANRSPSLSAGAPGPGCTTKNQAAPYAALKVASSGPTMPPAVPLPPPLMPKSILMKPSPSADPRLYQTSSRNMNSHSTADGETTQFLANQTILWKGFLNMLSVAKFMTKGYVVSGSGEILKAELPDTIQIGGRILPQTVWDYVERVKTSVTKELCVVRFHPATEEEEVAYVSLFSYFSSRRRFGVVANSSRNVKDMYLVPISAREAVPSILQPIEGAGLEKNRPNLLLGLAIVQKPKRPGCLQQESEEKRPKVQMSKDPISPAASGTLSIPSLPIPTTPVLQNLPTGIVVVSAATLTEQQRMLEELNKQIEEQKRQLKEQEEALRQQREAVEDNGSHLRGVVGERETIVEVLQEVLNSDHHLIHEDGRIEKDTEEVKGIGQDMALGTSLNGRAAIAENGPRGAIQEDKENPRTTNQVVVEKGQIWRDQGLIGEAGEVHISGGQDLIGGDKIWKAMDLTEPGQTGRAQGLIGEGQGVQILGGHGLIGIDQIWRVQGLVGEGWKGPMVQTSGDYGLIGEGQMVLISGNQGLIGEGWVVQISGGQGLMGGGQLVQISVKQEGQEVLTSSDQVLIGEVQVVQTLWDQGLKREGQVVQISGDQDLIEKGLVDQISGNKGLIGEGQISQTPWVQILIGEVLVVQTSWDQGLMGEGQVVQISGDQHLKEEGQVVQTSENQGLIGEGQVGQTSGDQGLIGEVHAGQTSGDPVLIGEGQMVQILGDQGLMGEGQVGQTGRTSEDQGLIGEGQVVQSSGDPVLK
ncbi:unnamed protein product [Merluccius merluccius]